MSKRATIAAALVFLVACGLLVAVLGPEDDGPGDPRGGLPRAPADPPLAPAVPQAPGSDEPPAALPPPSSSDLRPRPGPPTPAPPGERAHRGRIVDPDGRGVAGARVFAADPTGRPGAPLATSGPGGAFACDDADLLFVRAAGFASRVASGDATTIALARARRVEGTVLAEEANQPLEGAEVTGEGEAWRETVTTNAAGRFVLDAPSGPASVRVTFPERVTRVVDAQPVLTISLPRGVGLSGRLVDEGGAPVGPAEVWALGSNQLLRPQATRAGGDGRFTLRGGFDADEEVAVFAMASALATPVDPRWQSTAGELNVVLLPLGSVILEQVPAGAAPELWPVGIDLEGFRAVGRAVGPRVVFGDLAVGSYQLTEHGLALGPTVRVTSGDAHHVKFSAVAEVPATTTLLVRAVDPAGAPVAGAAVVASSDRAHTTVTADERGEAWLAISPGTVSLSATAPGRVLIAPLVRDAGDRDPVTLVLARVTTLSGRVLPAERAELRLTTLAGDEVRTEQSDARGLFEMKRLPEGDYVLEVTTEHKQPLKVNVTLPLSAALHVHLTEGYGDCGHED